MAGKALHYGIKSGSHDPSLYQVDEDGTYMGNATEYLYTYKYLHQNPEFGTFEKRELRNIERNEEGKVINSELIWTTDTPRQFLKRKDVYSILSVRKRVVGTNKESNDNSKIN